VIDDSTQSLRATLPKEFRARSFQRLPAHGR